MVGFFTLKIAHILQTKNSEVLSQSASSHLQMQQLTCIFLLDLTRK